MTEIYGGEHLLTRRAVNEAVGRKLIERIEWWIDHAGKLGSVINNNPSVIALFIKNSFPRRQSQNPTSGLKMIATP